MVLREEHHHPTIEADLATPEMGMPVRVPASDLPGLGQTEERTPVSDEDAERVKAERKAQRRARYLANREQILAQAKADRAANPERQRAWPWFRIRVKSGHKSTGHPKSPFATVSWHTTAR